MFLLVTAALADTFWDIPPAAAGRLRAALAPDDVLLRWCAGCGGEAVLYRIGDDQIAPGTYSKGKLVQVRWRALAIGPAAEDLKVYAAEPVCAAAPVCMPDPTEACASDWATVDVPYTWRRSAAGEWVWVGTLARLNPTKFAAPPTPTPDPAWVERALACAPVAGDPSPPAN